MADKNSGWLVKASCPGFPSVQITGLRPSASSGTSGGPGYQELVMDLSETFDLIPASVTLFSVHQGTKLSVHLGSQGDLDVVLAEAIEFGSHVITVSVSGVPARRSLDALGALLCAAATVSQLFYLAWIVTAEAISFYTEFTMWSVMIASVLINLGGYFYLLDDEKDKNHPFRLWSRPPSRQMAMLMLAPLTGDVLPLVSCKTCGLDAPVRASTRDGVVQWGVLMMAFQDGLVLKIMSGVHMGAEAIPLSTVPLACLSLTLLATAFNLPRRLSHFILESCEAAYREKGELADEAKISMYATQKMAFGHKSTPSKERPAAVETPPPAKAKAAAKAAAGGKPTKPQSFREQLKAGGKGQSKSLY